MAEEGLNGVTYYYYKNFTDYIFPASISMNIYYSLFIISLTYFSKDKMLSINMDIIEKIKKIYSFIITIYVIGFCVRLIPDYISFMDTLRRFLSLLPTIALLILTFVSAKNRNRKYRVTFVILILLEVFYATFFGFFKGEIIRPILLFILYYYIKCRYEGRTIINPQFISLMMFTGLFLYYFVYPFMTIKRTESGWDPATNITFYNYSSYDIFKRVLNGEGRESEENRNDAISDRQNAIPMNAYFYMSAIENGYNTTILEPAFDLPIPRWLGGGAKIERHQGYLADTYLNSGNFQVSKYGIHSAAYVGLFGSAYFWGGWLAVLFMIAFNGWLISWLLNFAISRGTNPFALIVLFNLVLESLTCFEEIHDGGIGRIKNYILFIVLAIIYDKLLIRKKHELAV
jgi:hypothetical protein